MKTLRLLPVVALAAAALAQDAPAPDPTGSLLSDALPPGADLVVHMPSVPGFLRSATESGFGSAETWSAAFREQLRRWAPDAEAADRLVRGGEALLRLADGEAVVAGMELPRLGSATAPRTRAAFFAFRSRAKEKELRTAVDDVIAGGLRDRYPGVTRTEQTMGRTVLALTGTYDGLWIRVQDHLVAVADHPLALGLFFRGLERVGREGRAKEDLSSFPIRVRWGRSDSPQRWEGLTFLQREAVTAGTKTLSGGAKTLPEGASVVTYVADEVIDLPVFPARIPEDVISKSKAMSARPLSVRLLPDGTWDVRGVGAAAEGDKPLVGSATRGAWLRAIRESRLAPPFRLDLDLLDGPLAVLDAAKPEVAAPLAEWRPGTEPGELRGPAWHGPVTFLTIRTLYDVLHGLAPNAPAPVSAEPPPKPDVQLPPPVPSRSPKSPGAPPSKPGDALPVPEDK